MIKNLNENETQKLLKEQKLGHLGCVLESGKPYVVPVNYLFKDDKFIYIACPDKNSMQCGQTAKSVCKSRKSKMPAVGKAQLHSENFRKLKE